MKQIKIPLAVLFALFVCTLAWGGGGPESNQGNGGRGQGRRGVGGFLGGAEQGWNERQSSRSSYGGENDKKYRSNLYNDDDVYGYDATYPNGEAAYINYKSKDARSRRGPEFARTSRAYSRQGAAPKKGNNFGQMNEYRGGGGMW